MIFKIFLLYILCMYVVDNKNSLDIFMMYDCLIINLNL